MFFRNRLHRVAVGKEPKKEVDATLDLLYTIIKGHWLANACKQLGISALNSPLTLPDSLLQAPFAEQRLYIEKLAKKVAEELSIIEDAFSGAQLQDTNDKVYNYMYGSYV